jgi:hypothetical protein
MPKPKNRPGTLDALINSPITNFLATMAPGIQGNVAKAFQPAVRAGRKAQLRGDSLSSQPEAPATPVSTKPTSSKPATPKREKVTLKQKELFLQQLVVQLNTA